MTLVELLVVIAVIALLIALLLPAIQAARESARTTHCKNNLKQLALGLQSFHQSRGRMPRYWGFDRTASKSDSDQVYGSWFVHLMPYVEQQAAYDEILTHGGLPGHKDTVVEPASADYRAASTSCWGGKYIRTGTYTKPGTTTNHVGHTHTNPPVTETTGYWNPPRTCKTTPGRGTPAKTQRSYKGLDAISQKVFEVLQCPSDPSKNAFGVKWRYNHYWTVTNYQGNWHTLTNGATNRNDKQALDNMPVQFKDITDGLSNTLVFAESYSRCDNVYRFALWGDCRTRTNNNSFPAYPSHSFGINWYKQPNTYFFQQTPHVSRCNNWRMQAMHPAGLSAAFLDGSVRSMRSSMSRQEQSDPQLDGTMKGQDPYPIDRYQAIADDLPLGIWDRLLLPRDGEQVSVDQ